MRATPATTMTTSSRCLLVLGALVFAMPARAQFALRADVVASGATDASGSGFRLRGTAGEPAVGRVAGGAFAVGQGFWYPATLATGGGGPLVDLTLTPIDPPPPVVIARGATLRYRADFAIAVNGPSQFQYWAEARLPNNQIRFLFGPVTVTGTPGSTVTRNLQQRVPQNVPLGNYVFRMKVGQFPNTVYDEDSFPVTVVAAEALVARAAAPALRAAPVSRGAADTAQRATRPAAARAAALPAAMPALTPSAAVPLAVARRLAAEPEAWLAWDADGTILEAGVVQDFRFAALDATRNGPADPEAAARAAGEGVVAVQPAGAGALPSALSLAPAFPNPFGGYTTLRFALPEAGRVRLAAYDALGRRVAVLVDGEREAGWHEAVLDGDALPAGVYLVRLTSGPSVQTQRVTLAR